MRSSDPKTHLLSKSTSELVRTFGTSPEFFSKLMDTKVEDFYEPNTKILFSWRDDPISSVWESLIKNNYMSMPVMTHMPERYAGFVDVSDIVGHLFKLFDDAPEHQTEDFWKHLSASDTFGETMVKEVMKNPLTHRNYFHPISVGFSMLHAFELLAKEKGLHRLPVVNERRELVNLITQSQVVNYLFRHIELIGPKMDKPLTRCPQFFKSIVSCSIMDTVQSAFSLMTTESVTGLAVLDLEGHLVENISTRDIKGVDFSLKKFWRFYQTTKAYLRHIRAEYERLHSRPHQAVYLSKEHTIGDAIRMLSSNHIHRVYICDDHKKPVGLITLKDLLHEIFTN